MGEGYAVWWRWVVDCGRWYWGRVDEEVADLSDDVPLQTPNALAASLPSVWRLWVYSIVPGPTFSEHQSWCAALLTSTCFVTWSTYSLETYVMTLRGSIERLLGYGEWGKKGGKT